ncbi:hypothetical protein Asppvi_001662 [Aspergillus pseudoviridinutans]|uniref:Uncharacterized protein n=1 Tax=Aspergillus pseudoviridinutans TaxID=1517512 RepID=A0A9P3B5H0_9EURO|nr:uncharacterized protein Asppvi_001662 [Aspergillus pseudoviridinutans]GIJ83143.1 hypothetical protein Asppvi_001662 [Aspergillus pseudoviridinutans]
MSEVATITDPDHPNKFHIAAGLSSLSTGGLGASPEPTSQTQKVKLVLLQPLANPDMLATCRNAGSRVTRRATGLSRGSSTREFSGYRPLSDTLCVQAGDVMNLVVTIATETRIRAMGNVCFEVVYDEAEGVAPRVLTRLGKQLLALRLFPGKKDGDRVNGL